jgi:hypothetical protein
MNPNMRVLRVFHIGETPEEDLEVTISPSIIKVVATRDNIIRDRPVKETTVFFIDDLEPMEFNLSPLDALTISQVAGAYSFGEEF